MAGQKVHSFGAHIAIRSDPDPINGGLAAPAYSDQAEDTDVIYTDIFFPECIAYGSTGVPRYLTDKVEVYSGAEQRNSRWEYPKHEYAIKLENVPADEISEIMRIWHVCSGDFAAFLFMDPLDHTTKISNTVLAGDEVSPTDQPVGAAVGGQAAYELYKFYDKASRSKRRRIKYPKLDTLRVAVGGVEVFNFDYDYDTGLLTFTQAIGSQTATVAISGGVFTGFTVGSLQVGDLVYLTGLAVGGQNRPEGGNPLRVTSITGGVTFEEYSGAAYTVSDDASQSVTIKSALPPTGGAITWGGYFYVPVRFDAGDNAESEITYGLRESAFANFDQLKLKEVLE